MRMHLFIIFLLISAIAAEAVDYSIFAVYPRAESQGLAGVASNLGVSGVYLNPVNILTKRDLEFIASSGRAFDDYNRFSMGFAKPIDPDGATYFGLNYCGAEIGGLQEVEKVGERPQVLSEFSSVRSVYILTAAHKFESFRAGVNLKYFTHNLFRESATAVAIDAGIQYDLLSNLTLGANWRNLNNAKMMWTTGQSDLLEQEKQIGLSWRTKAFYWPLSLSLDKIYGNSRVIYSRYGGEFWLVEDIFALRLGKDNTLLKAGCGLIIDNFSSDYVYSDQEDLGVSHTVSLGALF